MKAFTISISFILLLFVGGFFFFDKSGDKMVLEDKLSQGELVQLEEEEEEVMKDVVVVVIKTKKGDYIQKRVDTYFAIDLVKLSIKNSIKKAILIAGDSDFVPPILEAKENDTIVKLVYYKKTVQDELLNSCDECYEIDAEILTKWSFS